MGSRLPLLTNIVIVLWTTSCAPSPRTRDLDVVTLSSPSAPGSGEPHLAAVEGQIVMSWTEPAPEGGHHVMTAMLVGDAWTEPTSLVRSDSLFVNWADFPSIEGTAPGTLAAHWLARGPAGGMDYRVEMVTSTDGGSTWSEPWTPHEDGTPTEHGFVSHVAMPDGGTGMAWLDGREYANRTDGEATDSHGGGAEMTLRFRSIDPEGRRSPEVILDSRTCDCCQTAAAETTAGPIVAYRDRSPEEIRDIAVVRWTPDGWTEAVVVHPDGWEIPGCPVNGPALAARGDDVAIAWYTAAEGVARVKVAFSSDAGRTFSAPVQADDGHPEGRVDLVLGTDGTAWLSWLERTEDGADVRIRAIRPGAEPSPSTTVAASSESRAAGFPRMAVEPSGDLVIAWTEPTDPAIVHVARVLVAGTP